MNALHASQVSQGRDKGVASKIGWEGKRKVFCKVFSRIIPTLIPIPCKHAQRMMTTITLSSFGTKNIEVDVSKLQSKKGLTINEGSSSIAKTKKYSKKRQRKMYLAIRWREE